LTTEAWHIEFNPKKFLGRVNLDQLLERNQAYNESSINDAKSPCILCARTLGQGILLNDRSFLCKGCYNEVALISYPERYEALRRQHAIAKESRKLAKQAFVEKYEYKSDESTLVFFGWASLLLFFFHPGFLALTAILLVLGYDHNEKNKQKVAEWNGRRDEWERLNPEPPEPELRHFHDPSAILTTRDQSVLRIFNHWPGYPPFWKYLRAVVIAKDNSRCQVTGCPSRLELHVHHMKPVADGGTHAPSNLVSLCDFHHALEPEKGHERIWGDIKTRYFTLVCGHERSNRASLGTHIVRPHLRRLQLVTPGELSELKVAYGLSCPNCRSPDLHIDIAPDRNVVRVSCLVCKKSTEGAQQLTEETGPLLAEILFVAKNKGRWKARWDMLAERRAATWGVWTGDTVSARRRQHRENVEAFESAPTCSKCGSAMRLVKPKPTDSWKPFWGCRQYSVTGCKGSARHVPSDA
jgi:ssDNA-binding Zn-finger/Zn-ribbon topoisomerase 1